MATFETGSKVRVNEGELEGVTGTVTASDEHMTAVKLELMTGHVVIPIFTDMLVDGSEPHESLVHLRRLYPDFLRAPKADNYRFRLKTYLNGAHYLSDALNAEMLVRILEKNPPAGLEEVEFMLKKDDPNRGLAWKLLWSV